jgi:alkylation response protein AidB-like acyl-CoA dehydrogenase
MQPITNYSAARCLMTEEERAFQESVRRFMVKEVAPLVPRMEEEGRPAPGLLKRMGDLGMLGAGFPEEFGGCGGSLMTRAIVAEETARVCAGLDATLFVNISIVARHFAKFGTEAQKCKYLVPLLAGEASASICLTEPAGGSDALSPRTRAVKEGSQWIIHGSKTFITNSPIADFLLVFARTSGEDRRVEGGTCFIVDSGTPGLAVGQPFDKLCLRSSPTAEVFLDGVRVSSDAILGEPGGGFPIMLDGLDGERVFEGASCTGIAQACIDIAVPYALERKVFGHPIAQYQMMQDKIATMVMGTEMARNMFYTLVRALERGERVTRDAAILKLYASTMAVDVSRDAVQILGGYGLMEEYQVARLYRDAKHHEIGAGTSEIQKLIIARETLNAFRA